MSRTPLEHVQKDWSWDDSVLQIQTACIQDLARTLRRIEQLLLNLGHDGIHEVLQEHRHQARRLGILRRRKARLQRLRRKAKQAHV